MRFESYVIRTATDGSKNLTATCDQLPAQGTVSTAGGGFTIDMAGVREWAATLESSSFTGGVVKINYKLTPADTFSDNYVASMTPGTRYTHDTTDDVFWNKDTGCWLPVYQIQIEMDTIQDASKSGVIYLYLYRDCY